MKFLLPILKKLSKYTTAELQFMGYGLLGIIPYIVSCFQLFIWKNGINWFTGISVLVWMCGTILYGMIITWKFCEFYDKMISKIPRLIKNWITKLEEKDEGE